MQMPLIIFNKKALEMSFAWIFAIIAGAAILFIAVYIAITLVDVGEYEINTKTTQAIINLLDPLQTSTEQGKTPEPLTLTKETRIYTMCSSSGNFGENRIQIQEKSGFRDNQWTEKSGDIGTISQYIFADEEIQGKKIYFFIMPYKMPFKVADIMILHTKPYCFVNPVREIKDFIEPLSGNGINITNSVSQCPGNSIKVCFETKTGCDIGVYGAGEGIGIVQKDGKEIVYQGNLVYAAIFSSKNNYECGVKRIMMRLEYLSELYSKKAGFVSIKGCNTGLLSDINLLGTLAHNFKNPNDLNSIKTQADEIDRKNENAICQLY